MTNIVYIMVDDMGFADLSAEFMPRSFALMQSLGTQLDFHAMQNCAPSRAALMTGQDPSRFDMHGVDIIPEFTGLPVEENLLSEQLRDAGYATGIFGKWHLGIDPEQAPHNQGFDTSLSFMHGFINSYGVPEDGLAYSDGTFGHAHHGNENAAGHDMQLDGVPIYNSQYSTFLFRDAAQEFITDQAEAEKPFFAYVPFNAPHAPYQAPGDYVDLYQDRFGVTVEERALLSEYAQGVLAIGPDAVLDPATEAKLKDLLFYASVRAFDDAVADIYQTVIDTGIANDTLFMFASDNGAGVGLGRSGDNGDLRGGKGTFYDGGHKVANFIIWPEEIAPGQTVSEEIWIGDLAPTFLSVAGAEVPAEMDGIDVSDALKTNADLVREGGDYFVSHISKTEKTDAEFQTAIIAFRYDGLKYVRFFLLDSEDVVVASSDKLYDTNVDLSETTDVSDDPAYADALGRGRMIYENYGFDGLTGDAYLGSLRSHNRLEGWGDYRIPVEWGDFSITDPADPRIARYGSAGADTLTGDDGVNLLWGASGDDSLIGRGGDDSLRGGKGADMLDGGEGMDTADYARAATGVTADLQDATANAGEAYGDGYVSIEALRGSGFADDLAGDAGDNAIEGGEGDDSLTGRDGDDLLAGGAGADMLDGGAGTDIADYLASTDRVIADLMAPHLNAGDAVGDTYIDIEGIRGSDHGDSLRGNSADNLLRGAAGDDVLVGRGGDDALYGEAGDDILLGGEGNDSLHGGAGDDLFKYESGADTVDGGEGNDWISYAGAAEALTLDLALGGSNAGAAEALTLDLALGGSNAGAAAGDITVSVENVIGTALDDVIAGDDADNSLVGLDGDDALYGGNGDDTLKGGGGTNLLDGGDGFDSVAYVGADEAIIVDLASGYSAGGARDDTFVSIEAVYGSSFGDYIIGDASANLLVGHAGDDVLRGGAGDDTLEGGGGGDIFEGGQGFDVADFSASRSRVVVDLHKQHDTRAGALGDVFSSIESVVGTAFDDALVGNFQDDLFFGGDGDDRLFGRSGDDVLIGGRGADFHNGGGGSDTAAYLEAADGVIASLADAAVNAGEAAGDTYFLIENLTGGDAADILIGDAGNNGLSGGGGADALSGGGGDDALSGGSGHDLLEGGEGGDLLDGGDGFDTATYSASAVAIRVDLADDAENAGGASGDVLTSIEGLRDTAFDDTLYGNAADNLFDISSGDEVIDGRGGSDTVSYARAGTGVRVLLSNASANLGEALGDTYASIENVAGSAFDDVLRGNSGDNSLWGGAGDDDLRGGGGLDRIDGGDGRDRVEFVGLASVTVDLADSSLNAGAALGVELVSIESVLGSGNADAIYGDDADNTLVAWHGDDLVHGRGGDDILIGDLGADTLDGGAGTDRAIYRGTVGAVVDLLDNALNAGAALGDELVDIEELDGTGGNDVFSGDAHANVLLGRDGGDILLGRDGDDTLLGGAGADLMDGGGGRDIALYSDADAFVAINLSNNAGNAGFATGDILLAIEDILGSAYDDSITGDGAGNVLNGANGDDLLIGGGGADELIGAQGADIFGFGTGHGDDVIVDFDAGEDRIVLFGDIDPSGISLSGNPGDDILLESSLGTVRLDGTSFGAFDVSGIGLISARDDDVTAHAADPTTLSVTDLLANDVALDGGTARMTGLSASSAGGAVLTRSGDALTYSPGDAFAYLAEGEVATDTFEYTMTGATGVSDRASVTVAITGMNDAPTITSPLAVAVAENTLAAATITATDPDGDTPTFSITGGADAGLFGIDAVNGDLSFLLAPDFEMPGDADGDNLYEVEVAATDPGGASDTVAMMVTVDDDFLV